MYIFLELKRMLFDVHCTRQTGRQPESRKTTVCVRIATNDI